MSTWSILAPGPSLAAVRDSDLQGPVVAINTAVLAPLRVDVWSALDPPHKFTQILVRDEPLPVLWCKERQAKAWAKHGVRTWAYPDIEEDFRARFLPRTKPTFYTLNLTIFATISRAVGEGASVVRVFGADMDGAGYAYGVDMMDRDARQWAQRWRDEQKVWDLAEREWSAHGARIDRPKPAGAE